LAGLAGLAEWIARVQSSIVNFARRLMPPQIAVAAMIIALISLMVISRFGSVGNMTTTAEQKVESLVNQGQQKISGAGAMARSGFQRVSYGVNAILFSGPATEVPGHGIPAPAPSPAPNQAHGAAQSQPRSDHGANPDSPGNRDAGRKRRNRSERSTP
jgi:hypothetical protein